MVFDMPGQDQDSYDELFDDVFEYRECMFCPGTKHVNFLKTCIDCGKVVCSGCVRSFGLLDYCPDCSKCRICSSEACYFCELCNELLCNAHMKEGWENDDATGYREVTKACIDGCKEESYPLYER